MPLLLKLHQDSHLKGVKKHKSNILYLILDQLLKSTVVFALQIIFFLCIMWRTMDAAYEFSLVSVVENYRRKIILEQKTVFCFHEAWHCKVLDE